MPARWRVYAFFLINSQGILYYYWWGKYKVNPKINKMFNIRRNWLKPAAAGALKGQFTLYRSNVWAGSAKIIKGATAFRLR